MSADRITQLEVLNQQNPVRIQINAILQQIRRNIGTIAERLQRVHNDHAGRMLDIRQNMDDRRDAELQDLTRQHDVAMQALQNRVNQIPAEIRAQVEQGITAERNAAQALINANNLRIDRFIADTNHQTTNLLTELTNLNRGLVQIGNNPPINDPAHPLVGGRRKRSRRKIRKSRR